MDMDMNIDMNIDINIDTNTLSYRLYKCKNDNYSILDLSDLDIYYIPNIN